MPSSDSHWSQWGVQTQLCLNPQDAPENQLRSFNQQSISLDIVQASLEFPRETGLILRCAGKAGNPFQTTQGNRLPCRDQEGRRGSEEAVPGPSVFPSGEPGVSGDFWGSQEGCQNRARAI